MFNLLISGNSTAWEDVECSMPIDRFYGYKGAEAEVITLDRPESLRHLEEIPTLLMYEGGASGPNARVIRHGRVKNITRQGRILTFEFEPDLDRAYFNRRSILKYKNRLGRVGNFAFDRTEWLIYDGDLPPGLLDNAGATLSRRAAPRKRFAFKSLHLSNFLSYGPSAESIELKSLNVLIGPNGSGKSNFLEAFALLQAAPTQVARPIAAGGGVRNWLYQGQMPRRNPEPARLEVIIDYSIGGLRYALAFDEIGERFELTDELLEDESQQFPYDNIYYQWQGGYPVINVEGELKKLGHESIKPGLSILAQKNDSDVYDVLPDVAECFKQIKLYREWTFGPCSKLRSQARSDLPNNNLETDASNLGLILSNLRRRDYDNYQNFLGSLKILYPGIRDVDAHVEGGNVQIFLQENSGPIPASRLSDGTLRYLFLLAILYDPNPPPLICIEEPELGLHPDVLPTLARLLREASERTQLIVTTHSPILIDALSETPEYVLVCEQTEDGSTLTRLDADELKPWLEKYRLGQLWMRGDLGGTRW